MRSLALAPILVTLVGALYGWVYLDRGWVPHDEGTIGLSAQRVLDGELPHRDFDEVYTGGLSYLNAAAFEILGTSLASLRRVLFVFFVAWIPAVYFIAARFAPPPLAVAATLLAVAWSIPNYSAAMPSWYNLFFATFGTAALLAFFEGGRRRWLVLAGVFAGLSIGAKVVGLYFVAAALIALAYREQAESADELEARQGGPEPRVPSIGGRARAYSWLLTAAAAALVALLLLLVRRSFHAPELLHFLVPGAAVCAFLVWNEWRIERAPFRERFRRSLGLLGPFSLGLVLPLSILLLPYLASGSAGSLAHGLFVAPLQRVDFAAMRPLPMIAAVWVLPPILLVAGIARLRPDRQRVAALSTCAALVTLSVVAGSSWHVYRYTWAGMRTLVPAIVVLGLFLLARRISRREAPAPAALTLLAVAAFCSLVQYPFSSPIYFLYVAPLAALAALAAAGVERAPRPALAAVAVFYLAFAVNWIHPGFIYTMGTQYVQDDQTETLELERGGIRVSKWEKREYEALVNLVRLQHPKEGHLYATPDAPEVYFLTGLRNPTRTTFDFFDDADGRTDRIREALLKHDVGVVVLNRDPSFSKPPSESLLRLLERDFPLGGPVGRFLVRWNASATLPVSALPDSEGTER